MNAKRIYTYLSLLLIQAVVIMLAFPALLFNKGSFLFCSWGDGVKNYFTMYSYVKEPVGHDGLFKYNTFAYPFGDYVYYTDNTPLFSIPFRWFCHHVYDCSAYTIPAYNCFILLCLLLSTLLVYFIFKAFIGKNVISYLCALVLPWTNMQTQRIWQGDFNLSLSLFILAAIILCIKWYHHRGNAVKRLGIALMMVLLLFLAFLAHGYYIAIISMFLGGMLFFLGVACIRQRFGKLSMAASVIIPLVGFGVVMALLYATDKYISLRQSNAMCYDCEVLKTHFLLLFTHYDFQHLGFPFASTMPLQGEMAVYLGNMGLLSFGAILTGAVFSTAFRKKVMEVQRSFFSVPLNKAVFWAGLLSLSISFGEHYTTDRADIAIFTPIPWLNAMNSQQLLLLIIAVAVVVYGIVLAVNKGARARLMAIGRDYKAHPYRKALLLFCVALTIYLFVGKFSVPLVNITNPMFYLHFITQKVEQFRCLSRFSWPFFWSFNIWVMYTVMQLLREASPKAGGIVIVLLPIVCLTDVTDYVMKLRYESNKNNAFADSELKKSLPLHISANQYQAILPIPYYIVGSEDYPHTIDDNDRWSEYTMRLSLTTGLPLMSCKMSRTPPEYSVALLETVSDTIPPSVKNRLNARPILVALNKTLVNDPRQIDACALDRPMSRMYYAKANEFLLRHKVQPVDSLGDVYFYSWQPQ